MRRRHKRAIRQRRSNCPVACALDLAGDRWTLLIIRDLILGKTRFEEFLASEERIATNILSSRLKALEDLGFIVKEDDDLDRRRVRYSLTKSGKTLGKLVRGVAEWGLKNLPQTKLAPGIQK